MAPGLLRPGSLLGRCVLVACLTTLAPWAQARETLTWLLRELPPLTIFDGEQRGQGAVDHMLAMLVERMPEYDHVFTKVNRARSMQMLQSNLFTCDPTLLWTPERAQFIHYSIPAFGTLSNGLIIQAQDHALFAPFIADGQVDLKALLASGTSKLGTVAGRSYGAVIDDVLQKAPEDSLAPHHGSNAVASLLQMVAAGRMKALLGYATEVNYLAKLEGLERKKLLFIPVRGDSRYQFTHVGCSNTPKGHEAIAHIDQILGGLRQSVLPGLYAHWLTSEQRETYLSDLQTFFSANQRAAAQH